MHLGQTRCPVRGTAILTRSNICTIERITLGARAAEVLDLTTDAFGTDRRIQIQTCVPNMHFKASIPYLGGVPWPLFQTFLSPLPAPPRGSDANHPSHSSHSRHLLYLDC